MSHAWSISFSLLFLSLSHPFLDTTAQDPDGRTMDAGAHTESTLYYKAVGSIAIYFTTVIAALIVCISRTRLSANNAFYVLIAICSLFTTWFYIISWFKKEYEKLGSDLDRFIIESDLL